MKLVSASSKLTQVHINKIIFIFFCRLYGKPEQIASLVKILIIFRLWVEQKFQERVPRLI